jgi:GxxExxY protein
MRQGNDVQTAAIIGAAMEVHNNLGHGFLEAVYSNALALELMQADVPFRREVAIPVYYKGERLACGYRCDFLCFESILVEAKAQTALSDADISQVINYLRATDCDRALLLNFGVPRLQIRRLILTEEYRRRTPRPSDDVETTIS